MKSVLNNHRSFAKTTSPSTTAYRVLLGMVLTVTVLWCQGDAQAITTNGLAAWFKADTIGLADGASVSTWADSSPANNAGTATGTGLPLYHTGDVTSASQPYVAFNGAQTFLSANNLGITGDISATAFVVYKPVDDTAANGVFGLGDVAGSATAFGVYNNLFQNRLAVQYASGNPAYFTDNESTGFQIIQIDKIPGAINSTTSMKWNGADLAIDAGDSSSATPNVTDKPLKIGSWGFTTGPVGALNGSIAEVIVYNGALSSDDARQVSFYLGDKFSITVPEPSTVMFLVTGGLVLLRVRRK